MSLDVIEVVVPGLQGPAGAAAAVDTDSTMVANSDVRVASQKATKTALATKVTGPASAVDATPLVADGTTGKLIKNITFAAFKTSLSLVKADVGLGSVANVDTSTMANVSFTGLSAASAVSDTDTVPVNQGAGNLKQTFTAIKTWIQNWLGSASLTWSNKTLTSPTINGGTLSGTFAGDHTVSGNIAFGGSSYSFNGAGNVGIEFGRVDGVASTPFIDWHSGATAVDFDVRIQASGGTGSNGGGTINVTAATFSWSGATLATLTTSQTFTNKTLTSPTINGGALSGTFSGSPTYSGAVTFAASQTFFSNSAASATIIELGKTDGSAQSAVLGFHSSGNNIDYDCRIISTGGTGSSGNGDLQLVAATLGTGGDLSFGAQARFKSFTVATLPSAASWTRSGIYVSDGASNKRFAISDGSSWRFPDGAVVS